MVETYLYTYGGELRRVNEQKDYIGWYNKVVSEIFTGPEYKDGVSEKLYSVSNPVFLEQLALNDKIKKYLPVPTESDYEQGYFTRYFTTHKLNLPRELMEIDASTYDLIVNSGDLPYILYEPFSLTWALSTEENKIDPIPINFKSIMQANFNLIGLRKYFLNLKDFSKI